MFRRLSFANIVATAAAATAVYTAMALVALMACKNCRHIIIMRALTTVYSHSVGRKHRGSTTMFDKSICKSCRLQNYLFAVVARINLAFLDVCLWLSLVWIMVGDFRWRQMPAKTWARRRRRRRRRWKWHEWCLNSIVHIEWSPLSMRQLYRLSWLIISESQPSERLRKERRQIT